MICCSVESTVYHGGEVNYSTMFKENHGKSYKRGDNFVKASPAANFEIKEKCIQKSQAFTEITFTCNNLRDTHSN